MTIGAAVTAVVGAGLGGPAVVVAAGRVRRVGHVDTYADAGGEERAQKRKGLLGKNYQ